MGYTTMIGARAARKHSLGVTLIELMIVAALFSVTLGAIYAIARATFVNSAYHDAEMAAQEEARRGVQLMVTELREARGSSLTGQTLPNDQLTFRLPGDADGNGLPLNQSGYLESVGTVTYMRDSNDLNGDGVAAPQLVRVSRDDTGALTGVTVITNDIMPNEDTNGDGLLDPGEDTNGSRSLERGIWFERTGSLIRLTVDTQKTVQAGKRVWTSVATQVHPRN